MGKITLYHYTTKEGAEGIERSKQINQSPAGNKDAVFGEGVYLTSLSPAESKALIAQNNWDGRAGNIQFILKQGKVDIAIKITFDTNDPSLSKKESGTRDIYLFEDDLDLEEYGYKMIAVKDKK